MRKQDGQVRWPYVEFNKLLNELMVEAGIPLSSQGTPNTVVFEEMTGVDPGRVSRWRQGKNQPTVESLRQIAEGLAPHIGASSASLLIRLEVKAGRRSESEALASGQQEQSTPPLPRDLEGFIERARLLAAQSGTSPRRRQVLEAQIKDAEVALKASRALLKPFEDMLRGSIEEHEDAPER
jgi:transcriptional regulator with XRE-family HTH domain